MNYDDYDGLGLAKLVRDKQASPFELLSEAMRRADRFDPALNAIITPMHGSARARCYMPPGNGPFAGVPFLAKDLMLFFAGERLTNGSRALSDYRPLDDCGQAQAIRDAGFVTFGKTNCAELGTKPLTNPVAFGATHNPWDLSRNAGGSSGGSAAAVAARIVPMAAASDGGGSIRLPASYCGVFGFKPSRGLNPFDQESGWGGAVVSQAMTLSVRDSAAYLDWTSRRIKPDGDHPMPGSLLARTRQESPKLRIALNRESPLGGSVHHECRRAVDDTALLLQSLGHEVELCDTPYDAREVMQALLTVIAVYTRRDLKRMGEWLHQPWRSLPVEPQTRFLAEVGGGVSAAQLDTARAQWQKAATQLARFHEHYDVLLTPTVATLPMTLDESIVSIGERLAMQALNALRLGRYCYGPALLNRTIDKGLAALPFLQIANATGQPAMSVPLYWSEVGLPIGSHFMAARGKDGLLFGLAAQLEQARPWWDKRPPMLSDPAAMTQVIKEHEATAWAPAAAAVKV